ncbi:hypothetical protein [Streptomyces clavuligerus]|uniref:Uncharacterized protein n=1 Tax=Streptomyces clavuligerus TaxID=1901 RepID=B5GP89_STRCL|nr:hypothetical protein [Streptomyces clavuligerus]AXU13626.1 hypothetical protein D1794_13250 [Streptomyces clavuligerus]EDY48135.1 hypothetical protein SSCG_01163 [Streptomyces clavuligerus]EFG08231.1 Hypothetical protein SCLAV_3160 [Streptomyces clavuligerus]MBY6303590.1 hypothetical protein [Streptomyces clavuligerus]QCS06410.1 hypothetical protein CRV15_12685 [Streptomyces clavuligerus]
MSRGALLPRYGGPVPPPEGPDPTPAAHTTTTVERGAFALARCSCGWSGPARRSRERARVDARTHSAPEPLASGV